MNRLGVVGDLVTDPAILPVRKGKRPITVRGPLHVQCSDNSDDIPLRELVSEITAWPAVEASPLPVSTVDLVSLRVDEYFASNDSSNFITGTEFARVLFGAPTIYLSLPLSCAHWAIVRGWAEPHYSASFGLMPPGVMVVYTSRNENETAVCRSLFRISYHSALGARSGNTKESYMLRRGVNRSRTFEQTITVTK
jgi:hypothetical protein